MTALLCGSIEGCFVRQGWVSHDSRSLGGPKDGAGTGGYTVHGSGGRDGGANGKRMPL